MLKTLQPTYYTDSCVFRFTLQQSENFNPRSRTN